MVATTVVSVPQGGCGGGPTIFTVTALGAVDPRPIAMNARPEAWTDADHLVVETNSGSVNSAQSIVNVNTGASAPIPAEGFFAAALPGGL